MHLILLFLLYSSTVFCNEIFYKIFECENNAKIRGIANNEPLLAIVTEKEVVFGNVKNDFWFTNLKKINLTINLMGNSELVEFKFIKYDTVIICNNMECSICSNYNLTCTTIASYPMKSVNAESTNDMLFLRVVHERNNASYYSFKLNTYEKIGQKFDLSANYYEFKSLYSFSHGYYVYFVSEIKRQDDVALCMKGQFYTSSTRLNYDTVITQICNNDQSDDIVSLMDITVSCGVKSDNYATYSKNKTIHRNIYNNNVTGITYLSKENQLLIAIQDSSTFSFMCKFNISRIEAEFCKVWRYCQNDHRSNNFTKFYKSCSLKNQNNNVCFNHFIREDESCEPHKNSSYRCDTSLSKHGKYKWMKSHAILSGEIQQQQAYAALYGKMFSSDSQFYITINGILTKFNIEKQSYHFLKGLPLNNFKKITPWDSKNGIMYVDPVARDTVYFKNVFCSATECADILHSANVKCHFCKKQPAHIDGSSLTCKHYEKNKTYCGPLWQKAKDIIISQYKLSQILHENNLKVTYNGEEIANMECYPIDKIYFEHCTLGVDKLLAEHFTAVSPKNTIKIFVTVAVIVFFTIAISIVAACLFKKLTKRNAIKLTDLNNTTYPYLYLLRHHHPKHQPTYVNAQIHSKKIVILKKLGEGNFGIVYLADYKDKDETKKVAVKTFQCKREDVIKEIESLSSCEHENIVTFIGWTEITDKMFIILEYMHGGDLHSFLRNPNNLLIVETIFLYIFQILDAMIYLNEKKILHRDLAARNCLLNETYQILKISDFGLARKMDVNYEYRPANQHELPFRWVPLEALINGKFTVKGDIWSFAILIWEIFERGSLPYENLMSSVALVNFLESGKRLSRPQHCSKELYEIMKKCWHEIPGERPTFKTLQIEIKDLYDRLKADDERNMTNKAHEYVNQTKTKG